MKKLIFLVDDDKAYLQVLKNYLDKYQQPIEMFANGRNCVDNLYKLPSIIILDFNLNDPLSEYPDGSKVFSEITKRSPESKVIVLSNQESGAIVFQLMKLGMKEYIEKDNNVFKNLDEAFQAYGF